MKTYQYLCEHSRIGTVLDMSTAHVSWTQIRQIIMTCSRHRRLAGSAGFCPTRTTTWDYVQISGTYYQEAMATRHNSRGYF